MAINPALSLVHPGLGASVSGFLPDTARVLRAPNAAPTPVSDLDFGYGAPSGPSQNEPVQVASLPCALSEFRTRDGKQTVIVDRVETIVPWRVKFRATPELDVRVGDVLEIKTRRFKVIMSPTPGSFDVFCSANCQEIR